MVAADARIKNWGSGLFCNSKRLSSHQLLQLRKVGQSNNRVSEFALTPYEMLMDDIRWAYCCAIFLFFWVVMIDPVGQLTNIRWARRKYNSIPNILGLSASNWHMWSRK